MFVGDSLSLNQWESLTCMLHAAVPKSKYTVDRQKDLSTFTIPVTLSLSLVFSFCSFFFLHIFILHYIRYRLIVFNTSFLSDTSRTLQVRSTCYNGVSTETKKNKKNLL